MAQHRVEAVRVVLDGGVELDAVELSQAGAVHRRAKLNVAQLLEALPRRAILILPQGEVPGLGGSPEVVGHQPSVVVDRCVLAAEKLLTMIEPDQRVVEAIERRELELVETRGRLTRAVERQNRNERHLGGA
jgi:hypothetical protein